MIDPTDVEANYVELIRLSASHARLLEVLKNVDALLTEEDAYISISVPGRGFWSAKMAPPGNVFAAQWKIERDAAIAAAGGPLEATAKAALQAADAARARTVERYPRCVECGRNYADPPSKLCPACQAYAEHHR